MPLPTWALAKVKTGVPDKITCPSSPDTIPESAAVPLTVAAVVPSYTLVTPLRPLMLKAFAEIVAVKPVGWVSV